VSEDVVYLGPYDGGAFYGTGTMLYWEGVTSWSTNAPVRIQIDGMGSAMLYSLALALVDLAWAASEGCGWSAAGALSSLSLSLVTYDFDMMRNSASYLGDCIVKGFKDAEVM